MLILVFLIQWKLFIQTALEQGILFRGYFYCEGAFWIWGWITGQRLNTLNWKLVHFWTIVPLTNNFRLLWKAWHI